MRTDPVLSEMLVTRSLDVMTWLRSKGAKFVPNFGRQSALVNGKRKFFGRMPLEVSGGGRGLVQFLDTAVEKAGIDIHYRTRAKSLVTDGDHGGDDNAARSNPPRRATAAASSDSRPALSGSSAPG